MRAFLSIGFALAALCCSPASGAEAKSVGQLIQALASPDESARLEAIDHLGLKGEKAAEAVPALTRLLGADSALVRAHAAGALARIGAPAKSAAEALAKLITDPDKRVRRAAIDALHHIRPGPEVMIPLLVQLMEDADPAARIRALHAMAEGYQEGVPHLVEALQRGGRAAYWACVVACEIGPDAKAAVPTLIGLLASDDHGLRREAILALAAIGEASAPAVPALAKALDDEINRVPATYALGSIGKLPDRVEQKIEGNVKSPDAILSTVSMWALAKLHPDNKQLVRRVVERLAEALKSEDPQHRKAAVRALVDLDPDPEISRPIIKRAMDGASPETLDAVMDAAASLGAKVLPRLIEALKVEQARPRAAAIIARIGPEAKDAVPALIDALGDPDPDTRNEVLFALAAIGPDAAQAVPALVKALDDPGENVSYAACYALGKIGPAAMAAKPALQKCLDSSDEFACMASAWALAQIHPECKETAAKSVPILVKALGEPDALSRLHAAEALRCLGPCAKDAAPALKKALQDENPDVREAAGQALKAIGG